MAEAKTHFERWCDVIAKTPSPMRGKQVYTGKNMDGDVFIRSENGGYAPLVTVCVEKAECELNFHMSPYAAREVAMMLKVAADAADPDNDHP